MLIQDLLDSSDGGFATRELNALEIKCKQFLRESASLPLYKLLPKSYNDFHRVKVRQHKHKDNVTEVFDKAFGNQFTNLRQRAIFASGCKPQQTNEHDAFYVFPVDGYKFLYSKEIKNSSHDYRQVVDTLFEQFEDNNKVVEIVTDLLKYTYIRENLVEGIVSESEIILYGIPFYYAVRVEKVAPYGKLFIR